ncbi:hypothetical protein C7121_11980 [Paenibacillus glucanolyticus]|jgi:LCP family protein required for cell wall assembly|uniref:LCP family glycopolymer transferase n=1 Tax=Paenibacillus TaxID=44249 RepID=UPI0003E226E9|nr:MULTISPECIES: LCP family protein [Paenibacillus]ANA79270.1 hypothetical protein A3958_04350 [Paenibacillus glucanolyticus]AVV56787.1 hypothetical protein C7121_11980 [Paenibacillus glucanolyticus]AWP25952.1 hypothetical protein B9D94_04660 [Paenibacillus sp. Cedars]ETT37910.1 cell envelope-like transcriptional attenuator [Paenibacillus sp. FSL R5-808]MPY18617.1 hypothetical protein [Paenibacillus glucanolyticus]
MRKWLKITGTALVSLTVLAGGYGIYVYQSVKATAEQIYEQREPSSLPAFISADPVLEEIHSADIDQREPFTVLVLGIDERPNDRGRSDAMIMLSVNPSKQSILMFNIPRDTRTLIVGHGTEDKINHAYAFGGIQMSVRTVEELLHFPVNYYIKVNMEGFANIIDALGGVDVDNTITFNYEGHHFKEGSLHLNGQEALAYSRMRYEDPRGDLGRNSRQRQIVKEVLKNALDVSTAFKLETLLKEVGTSVKTDIRFDEMKTFVTEYRQDMKKIEQVEIQGSGQNIGGIWYYNVADKERERIHELLKEHMDREGS